MNNGSFIYLFKFPYMYVRTCIYLYMYLYIYTCVFLVHVRMIERVCEFSLAWKYAPISRTKTVPSLMVTILWIKMTWRRSILALTHCIGLSVRICAPSRGIRESKGVWGWALWRESHSWRDRGERDSWAAAYSRARFAIRSGSRDSSYCRWRKKRDGAIRYGRHKTALLSERTGDRWW